MNLSMESGVDTRNVGITAKMIAGNAILLVLVVGLFGMLTMMQGSQVVEHSTESSQRLRTHVQRVIAAVEESALPPRGVLLADLKALDAELASQANTKQSALSSSLVYVALIGVLVLLLGIAFTIVQSVKISGPIRALDQQAARIASGDFSARVDVTTNDEIGALGHRFNSMAEKVAGLMEDRLQRVMLEEELGVASAVQEALIPDTAAVDLEGLSIAGYFKPTAQCAGDWWDFAELEDGRVLVIVGDATGHGAASAMITAAAKGAATAVRVQQGKNLAVAELLHAMNWAIHGVARGRFVMTCFASIYDHKTRTLEFANAGHPFPYLFQGSTLKPLVARGNRLGDATYSEFEISKVTIEQGSTIVWYTDGIIDSENAEKEKFGERRFRKAIEAHGHLYPAPARDEILARVNEFYAGTLPKDDIVLVLGRFS